MADMRFSSASATGDDLDALLEEVSSRALADLGDGGPPDLAVLFATPDFGPEAAEAGPRVRARTAAREFLGCSGAGVIGAEAEREDGHATALLLARLPGADLVPFRVTQEDLESSDPGETIRGRVGAAGKGGPQAFLLLADPYSIDGEALLAALEDAAPGRPVLGGFASGAGAPRGHALWLSRDVHRDGAVGLAVDGAIRVAPLVSQGCRPIGRRFTVTKASGQRIATLAGKPAVEALREVLEGLGAEDRDLARTGLHLGRAAIEAKAEFGRGDFLVRNIVGVVPEDGSLVVGDHVEVGQTVQFQLRDAASATEDLSLLLDGQSSSGRPGAALLFSCGGRGSRMFGRRDHDIGLIREKFGDLPIAGFFCNGEIGPVGSRSFLHGFTSSLAIFRAP